MNKNGKSKTGRKKAQARKGSQAEQESSGLGHSSHEEAGHDPPEEAQLENDEVAEVENIWHSTDNT